MSMLNDKAAGLIGASLPPARSIVLPATVPSYPLCR
jgi:hypothetical protein